MPSPRAFGLEHVDYLEQLTRLDSDLTVAELAVRMSRQFKRRITPAQVNTLMQRMRTPSDPFFRDLPYRRAGARYTG
jgi:hypothetical protein